MNTFRNKQFKNELDPKYAFYDCHSSCQIKTSSKKSKDKLNKDVKKMIIKKDKNPEK